MHILEMRLLFIIIIIEILLSQLHSFPHMVSEQVKKLFPHEKIRSGQEELINDLETAFTNEKILLAHAPTGLGKTASALTVALIQAIEKKKTIFFLTNRHTQHKIAIDTLKAIKEKSLVDFSCVDIIGKIWMCNQEIAGLFGNEFNEYCKTIIEKGECEFYNNVRQKKELTVEAKKLLGDLKQRALHNEELISICKDEKKCSYEMALALAKEARVIIGDYYYIFNPFVQNNFFNRLGLEMKDIILIVDEGHNLPNRVTEMLSNNLSANMLKNAVMEAKKFGYGGMIFWLQELMRILNELADFSEKEFAKEKKVTKEQFLDKIKKIVDYEELIDELEMAAEEVRRKQRKSYLGGISSFLSAWKGDDEGYCRFISEQKTRMGPMLMLSYHCLDPGIITKDIFEQVHAGVIMSGTLQPTFMYKDLLGITKGKGIEKEYSSPFPLENKLSLIIPETSTKYTLRNALMYQRIGTICSELTHLIPGNVAFFFPSYDLRDQIDNFIKTGKRKFLEKMEMSKEEKQNFLEQFKAEKKLGGVLLGVTGANFAEGIDLPGDLLNGVVVVGLPLARPDLQTKELINYYEKKFGKGWDYGYTFPAINKCLQSAGRCIRSEKDVGAVIFLEERFAWQSYLCCFPREGLRISKDYALLVKKFFEEMR